MPVKSNFEKQLKSFVESLNEYVATDDGQWTIKGFIDVFKNVYTISSDTKIISKILEIHIFPKILRFAETEGYKLVLAQHQNYYPDISFVNASDEKIKFAVDFKTTYRLENPEYCNGFTLGSHGEYFVNRSSRKNIQFPYSEYLGHFCLGIIYTRGENTTIDETKSYKMDQLQSITSVIKDIQFFVTEKWKIASDKRGSGNTANIGSINCISDIIGGNGMFSKLGEKWFDDYWMNYGKITTTDKSGKTKKSTKLEDFVLYRKGNIKLIVKKNGKSNKAKK
ncbi:MAG: EcoRV family type II restriction endonuclease [Bacteroidetes bacterium]|nr:EcoRV family type II restriction endonuclease [Bacteroidota bacterium]MBU2586278.1 EcoRV family type II restriction endonuclease [Bacteroidota bacterium]